MISKWLKLVSFYLAIQIIMIPFALAANQNTHYFYVGSSAWQPLISIGIGGAMTSDTGSSKTFPIVDPISNEFYQYTANETWQTSTLFDVFLGGEWAFHSNWQLQLGLGYNQSEVFTAKGYLLQGADTQSADQYSYHYNILARQILIAGKLLYQFHECFHPYVLGGFGFSINKTYNYVTDVPPFLTFTRQYANNTASSFSYNMGFGIDVDITNHLRLGVGYRFLDIGKLKLGNATIDTTSVSGTLSQSHLYVHELLTQLTLLC